MSLPVAPFLWEPVAAAAPLIGAYAYAKWRNMFGWKQRKSTRKRSRSVSGAGAGRGKRQRWTTRARSVGGRRRKVTFSKYTYKRRGRKKGYGKNMKKKSKLYWTNREKVKHPLLPEKITRKIVYKNKMRFDMTNTMTNQHVRFRVNDCMNPHDISSPSGSEWNHSAKDYMYYQGQYKKRTCIGSKIKVWFPPIPNYQTEAGDGGDGKQMETETKEQRWADSPATFYGGIIMTKETTDAAFSNRNHVLRTRKERIKMLNREGQAGNGTFFTSCWSIKAVEGLEDGNILDDAKLSMSDVGFSGANFTGGQVTTPHYYYVNIWQDSENKSTLAISNCMVTIEYIYVFSEPIQNWLGQNVAV